MGGKPLNQPQKQDVLFFVRKKNSDSFETEDLKMGKRTSCGRIELDTGCADVKKRKN